MGRDVETRGPRLQLLVRIRVPGATVAGIHRERHVLRAAAGQLIRRLVLHHPPTHGQYLPGHRIGRERIRQAAGDHAAVEFGPPQGVRSEAET